jgi:hypothetical protein
VRAAASRAVMVRVHDRGSNRCNGGVAQELRDGAAVEPVGVRMRRGAEQPVQLFRLAYREERRDPVCGLTSHTTVCAGG